MTRKPVGPRQLTVTFYGEDIIAMQELEPNETYAVIANVCEKLGLERGAQERRVRSHALLAEGARRLEVETDHGVEQMWCLRLDLLPLWLATLDSSQVAEGARARLELYQRECASVLWQSFKPQGFGVEDTLLPVRHQQSAAEQAYVTAVGMATLARHQMLIERQLNAAGTTRDAQASDPYADSGSLDDPQAALLARTVRRVATSAAERSRRNEYGGIYSGLYRQFSITSYRRMPPARLHEALEWLERWHGDLLGQPEPPPDI